MIKCKVCKADVTKDAIMPRGSSDYFCRACWSIYAPPPEKTVADTTLGEVEALRAKFDAIAADFALATDTFADGNRSAEARARIKAVLAGHVPEMVPRVHLEPHVAMTMKAQEREREALRRAEKAEKEVARLHAHCESVELAMSEWQLRAEKAERQVAALREALQAEQTFADHAAWWNEKNPDAVLPTGWCFGEPDGEALHDKAERLRVALLADVDGTAIAARWVSREENADLEERSVFAMNLWQLRADKAEKERDEARTEVDALKAKEKDVAELNRYLTEVEKERDEALGKAQREREYANERLAERVDAEKERDEARAEVVRLRAERDHTRTVLCAARDESSAGIRDEWDAAHGGTNARDMFAPEHDPVIHGAEQEKPPEVADDAVVPTNRRARCMCGCDFVTSTPTWRCPWCGALGGGPERKEPTR